MAQAGAHKPLFVRWQQIAGLTLAAWTVFGVLLGQQVYALRSGPSPTWGQSMFLQLSYCTTWALLTPLVWWLGARFPLDQASWKRSVPIHLLASLFAAAAAQSGEILMLTAARVSWFPTPELSRVFRSIFSTLDYGASLYWIVLLVGQSFTHLRRRQADQLLQSELQTQLAEARLQALRMQMHPHFLFNALNSIAALIHDDPDAADRMVSGLSELLRIYLRSSETQEVRLREEMEFLERYLDIQQVRFEDRLAVELDLDPRTLPALVPSLILQPLVENAIRHGIAERDTQGIIRIHSSLHDGRIELLVADNGSGRGAPPWGPEGTGLRNTRRRLETIYGGNHQFHIETQPRGGVKVSITIPFRDDVAEVLHDGGSHD